MIREVAQGRPARRVEPAFHPCEVPVPGCVWQIVRYGPDPQQYWNQMGVRISERVDIDPGWRQRRTVQHGRIEFQKRLKESCAILHRRHHPQLDQSNLEFHACVGQQPCVAPQ